MSAEKSRGMSTLPESYKGLLADTIKPNLYDFLSEDLGSDASLGKPITQPANRIEKLLANVDNGISYKLENDRYLTQQDLPSGLKLLYLTDSSQFNPLHRTLPICALYVELLDGRVVDLSQIFPPQHTLLFNLKENLNKDFPNKTEILPYKDNSRGDIQLESILHEAGHAWRNLFISEEDRRKETKARAALMFPLGSEAMPAPFKWFADKFVFNRDLFIEAKSVASTMERDPTSIALLFYRAYKQMGVDLAPGKSSKDVRRVFQSDFSLYEDATSAVPRKPRQAGGTTGFSSSWYLDEQEQNDV